MERKWKSFIPWILLGSIFFYSLLWYGIPLFFEREMKNFGERMKAKGLSFSVSSSFGGYPLKFCGFLHNLKVEWNKEVFISIPSLLIESNFLFPFTRTLFIRLEDTGKAVFRKKGYTINVSDLSGKFRFSPTMLDLKANSVTFLQRKTSIGDLQKAKLLLTLDSPDKLRTDLDGHLNLRFTNVLMPTLEIEINLQLLFHHWEEWLYLGSSNQQARYPIRLDLESFALKTVGSTFKGTGFVLKNPQTPWEGDVDLKLHGLFYFIDLLENFFHKTNSPLLQLLNQLPNFFKRDTLGELNLPLHLQNERLSIRDFLFFSLPLKE